MRVVLHCHSTWSYDGHWPLGRIAKTFGALGIDAVMMTEHDTGFDPGRFGAYRQACAEASTRRCKLIPGIEYSSPDNDIHLLSWGLDRFLAEHRPVMETLHAIRRGGGVAVFAHPVRREAWRRFEPDWVPYLSGIELWNRKSDGLTWGREAERLIAETGLPATVGMDFHRARHFYALSHRVAVDRGRDLEADLVSAIRTGALRPMALGRPLLDAQGRPDGPHDRLEQWRRATLKRLRGR
ncbi:PHP domain-containing protein [Limimaricola litoreus]